MNRENNNTANAEPVLENLTRTLLYEGYALYPYHRSAVKNQKPIPFGVVFPQRYNAYNEHAHANMQTQCIVTGNDALILNISVRFLHLKRIELFQYTAAEENFIHAGDLNINGKFYQAGWQTIERKINTGDLPVSHLLNEKKMISFGFEKMFDKNYLYNKNDVVEGKQTDTVSGMSGIIHIEATPAENAAFRVTVTLTNTTPVENAETITRDEVLNRSFLSTHIILHAPNGEFISHQGPGEKWEAAMANCENINTWPILIDDRNTILLSSPIILYDHPQINPQSHGDLFDSTEIEEALLLHVNLLSVEEKKRIAQGDEKLKAMFNKVSNITPEELKNFHSGLKDSTNEFIR